MFMGSECNLRRPPTTTLYHRIPHNFANFDIKVRFSETPDSLSPARLVRVPGWRPIQAGSASHPPLLTPPPPKGGGVNPSFLDGKVQALILPLSLLGCEKLRAAVETCTQPSCERCSVPSSHTCSLCPGRSTGGLQHRAPPTSLRVHRSEDVHFIGQQPARSKLRSAAFHLPASIFQSAEIHEQGHHQGGCGRFQEDSESHAHARARTHVHTLFWWLHQPSRFFCFCFDRIPSSCGCNKFCLCPRSR